MLWWWVLESPSFLVRTTQHWSSLTTSFGLTLFFISSVWAATPSCVKEWRSKPPPLLLGTSSFQSLALSNKLFPLNMGFCFAPQENEVLIQKQLLGPEENQVLLMYLFNDEIYLPYHRSVYFLFLDFVEHICWLTCNCCSFMGLHGAFYLLSDSIPCSASITRFLTTSSIPAVLVFVVRISSNCPSIPIAKYLKCDNWQVPGLH